MDNSRHRHDGHSHPEDGRRHHAGHPDGTPDTHGRSFAIAIALNTGFVAIEFAYGFIALEAMRRFTEPAEVAGMTVSIVAAIGIAINGFSAWLFVAGSKQDLNIRGAFLHMAADALVSLGVVIGGVTMLYTGWYWLDPVLSLMIVAVVLIGTWGLLRDALRLSLSAVPAHIDLQAVQQFLADFPGVADVQDLHIWGMSTTETALTVHLIMPDGYPGDGFMAWISNELKERFAVQHSTLQIMRKASGSGGMLENGLEVR